MHSLKTAHRLTIAVLALVVIGTTTVSLAAEEETASRNPALLDPSLATEKAPDSFKVKMETTAGDFVIEVHREWAPRGADRFFNLVKIGYYDNTAFYRVIKGFMAQIGMNGDPEVTQAWMDARIRDDVVTQSNTKGMVTFAMSGDPNSRTAQIFINYGDNAYLDEMGFAPFGKVVEGQESVDALYGGYGEGAPRGKGPSQSRLFRGGNDYLKGEFPELDYVVTATIVE
jgi:peptidyl-prolyl cis-trans isomerase A (cyclophilin A)